MRSSISWDQFRANVKLAAKLARQPNGIEVVNEFGRRVFSVWIPSIYNDADAEKYLAMTPRRPTEYV